MLETRHGVTARHMSARTSARPTSRLLTFSVPMTQRHQSRQQTDNAKHPPDADRTFRSSAGSLGSGTHSESCRFMTRAAETPVTPAPHAHPSRHQRPSCCSRWLSGGSPPTCAATSADRVTGGGRDRLRQRPRRARRTWPTQWHGNAPKHPPVATKRRQTETTRRPASQPVAKAGRPDLVSPRVSCPTPPPSPVEHNRPPRGGCATATTSSVGAVPRAHGRRGAARGRRRGGTAPRPARAPVRRQRGACGGPAPPDGESVGCSSGCASSGSTSSTRVQGRATSTRGQTWGLRLTKR